VATVEFPTTADGARRLEEAAPLLSVVDPEGEEILIPYVQTFLLNLSVAGKTIEMCLPSGIAELNRRPRNPSRKLPDSGANSV
jgi:16S rRNA processing protein RimM